MPVNRIGGVFTCLVAGLSIYYAATADGPFDGERAGQWALAGIPVWLATKLMGWFSFGVNDFLKHGIVGVLFATPVAIAIMAFRAPVMIFGILGLLVGLAWSYSNMVKWEMRREEYAREKLMEEFYKS